jgi:hypothetical protein
VSRKLHPARGAMCRLELANSFSVASFPMPTEHCTPDGVRPGKSTSLYTSHPCRGAVSSLPDFLTSSADYEIRSPLFPTDSFRRDYERLGDVSTGQCGR